MNTAGYVNEKSTKKHISQMTPGEVELLVEHLKKINPKKLKRCNSIKRSNAVIFDVNTVRDMLRSPDLADMIIEYKKYYRNSSDESRGPIDHRVTLKCPTIERVEFTSKRGNKHVFDGRLCVVLTLEKPLILKAFWLDTETITDYNRYNAELRIKIDG